MFRIWRQGALRDQKGRLTGITLLRAVRDEQYKDQYKVQYDGCMSTDVPAAHATPQQHLLNAVSELASNAVTEQRLDAVDRKAMADSLLVQLEAHIDGRLTRHPDTFQQQLKVIEHGSRRALSPSLLAHLEAIVVEGPPAGRNAAGISGGEAGSKAPLYVPALDISDDIRTTCRTAASRITGRPTQLRSATQPLGELVRAYASAALTAGPEEASKALAAALSWIKAIRSLMDPPVIQEILAPCGNCGERALSLRVVDGASSIKCRSCGVRIPPTALFESAAWLRDMTEEELQQSVAAEYARPAPAVKNVSGQVMTLSEFASYCEEHGHLPPSNAGNDRERRLAQWARQHSRGATNTFEAAERRKAIQAIQEQYPSKREANRLAKIDQWSEAA